MGTEAGFPFAFFAVVAIAAIGLYIAYVTPVYLRWRAGSSFEPGSWNLGEKYRWMNVVAAIWVAISVVVFLLPFAPTGLPWNDDFDATTLNYAPAIVAVFLVLVIWWILSASKTYEGPVSTIDFDEGLGITDEKEEPTARA